MAGILEKMGLVRTEEVPLVTPLGNLVPAVEPEDAPEIDASQVSYEDVIHSVYQQGGFSTTASKSLIMDGIVFRKDFAEAHPDVITAFADGVFQANDMYIVSAGAIL